MRVVTWVYRIIDESNVWLNARKLEDIGDYDEAAIAYLKDAADSLKKGSLTRAGLSCSSAADCLVKLDSDDLSRKLYAKAGTIYEKNADSAFSRSMREWLWSLQKAYENFLMGGETPKAEAVHNRYAHLASKIDPLLQELEPLSPEPTSNLPSRTLGGAGPPEKVIDAVRRFLEQQTLLTERSGAVPGEEAGGGR